MSFLNPAAILIAALLTVPPLVVLYFLKLKRDVRTVPSTLLWRRAVADLQVNSPFQRLRSSLLLILQLLILFAAAIALGQPMFQAVEAYEGTLVFLIDQSASMGIMEEDGFSRLERAKEEAERHVERMSSDARAMIIGFSDRATVVSSFDTDKRALLRKIDSIEETQARSNLGEAMSLAEAYTQNIIIGTEEAGSEIAPESPAPTASVFIFTDGQIEDADSVALQRFDIEKIRMVPVGSRSDNVGILAMDARRNYERPEVLEVVATVRNFGSEPVAFDAVVMVDGESVDIKTVRLGSAAERGAESRGTRRRAASGSAQVIAFDEIEFGWGGIVEVVLRVDDALSADNRAWTVIDPPRHMRVLLVTMGNMFLEQVLSTLPLELTRMTGEEYERVDDTEISDGDRSLFDVVIMDGHSTERLPQGNYVFWGAIPQLDGVAVGETIDDQVIFNWDDTHPILRHVLVDGLYVTEWLELRLPREAISLIDGETSPVMAYLTRDASQFLISAFGLIIEDESGNRFMNTHWVTSVDFVIFMQNALQYLSASLTTTGKKSVAPGEPVTLPLPKRVQNVKVHRPDGTIDTVPSAGHQTVHYASTRHVGTYRLEPGIEGHDQFAVNLFDTVESSVGPTDGLVLGASSIEASSQRVEVNRPAWPYVLMAMLVVLLLEWIVYNQRVFV